MTNKTLSEKVKDLERLEEGWRQRYTYDLIREIKIEYGRKIEIFSTSQVTPERYGVEFTYFNIETSPEKAKDPFKKIAKIFPFKGVAYLNKQKENLTDAAKTILEKKDYKIISEFLNLKESDDDKLIKSLMTNKEKLDFYNKFRR
jgi:hypothetical protein